MSRCVVERVDEWSLDEWCAMDELDCLYGEYDCYHDVYDDGYGGGGGYCDGVWGAG
jgi:hypothetical protein